MRVVSAILYAFDPDGMGRSVFAPSDEYDEAASRLISKSRDADDVHAMVSKQYPDAEEQMVGAVADTVALFLETPAT